MPLLQVFLVMAALCLLVTCGGVTAMLYYIGRKDIQKAELAFNVAKDATMCAAGLVGVSIFGLFFI